MRSRRGEVRCAMSITAVWGRSSLDLPPKLPSTSAECTFIHASPFSDTQHLAHGWLIAAQFHRCCNMSMNEWSALLNCCNARGRRNCRQRRAPCLPLLVQNGESRAAIEQSAELLCTNSMKFLSLHTALLPL